MIETSWRHFSVSLQVSRIFVDISTTFRVHSSAWGTGFRGDIFQLISKGLELVGWLSRTSGSTAPPPFLPKFYQK